MVRLVKKMVATNSEPRSTEAAVKRRESREAKDSAGADVFLQASQYTRKHALEYPGQ